MQLSETEELANDIGSFAFDPLGHALYAYEWGKGELIGEGRDRPRRWQKEVFEYIGERLQNPATRYKPIKIAVCSGHGIGKSAFISMLVKWGMDTCVGCNAVVTANTGQQLNTKTWPELAKWFRMALTRDWFDVKSESIRSTDPEYEKNWKADAVTWSEHNTEAFAGLHNAGKVIILVMDEASAIADKVWEVAEGALTDQDTVIIWVAFGNGTRATGRFRDCFDRLKHRWKTWQIDSRDVEGTNKEEIAELIADNGIDSDVVKVRVRGMFPSQSYKQFISTDLVDAAFGKHLRKEQYSFAPKILTCDPAWEGDDELVIGLRQGLSFKILKVMPKNDNDIFIANLLARYEDELGCDAVFIDAGYGTGIVSAGRTMGREWQLVWFGGASNDPGCHLKRDEMINSVKKWLAEGGSIPDDKVLHGQLVGIEAIPMLDGKVKIESGKDMKKRGVASPDRLMALALSFAFPVDMPVMTLGGERMPLKNSSRADTEYNPYERAGMR